MSQYQLQELNPSQSSPRPDDSSDRDGQLEDHHIQDDVGSNVDERERMLRTSSDDEPATELKPYDDDLDQDDEIQALIDKVSKPRKEPIRSNPHLQELTRRRAQPVANHFFVIPTFALFVLYVRDRTFQRQHVLPFVDGFQDPSIQSPRN